MAFSCCSFKFYVGDLYPTAMPLMWSGSTRFISASINLIKFLTYVMVRNKYLTASDVACGHSNIIDWAGFGQLELNVGISMSLREI